jgi:hypothetical protein
MTRIIDGDDSVSFAEIKLLLTKYLSGHHPELNHWNVRECVMCKHRQQQSSTIVGQGTRKANQNGWLVDRDDADDGLVVDGKGHSSDDDGDNNGCDADRDNHPNPTTTETASTTTRTLDFC